MKTTTTTTTMTRRRRLLRGLAVLGLLLLAVPLSTLVVDMLQEHTTLLTPALVEPADYMAELDHHLRRTLQQQELGTTHDASGPVIGTTITVDFYRTFYEASFLGLFHYRKYKFPKWRTQTLLKNVEKWYNGRVKFAVGQIYDYENVDFPMVDLSDNFQTCFTRAAALSVTDPRFNRRNISIIVSQKLGVNLSCHGGLDSTLGAPKAAVAVIGTNFQGYVGGSLAHATGHLLGLDHTTEDFVKGLRSYFQCGLNLRYPFFPIYNDTNFFFGKPTDVFVQNGVRYDANEWMGRLNMLARFKPTTAIIKGATGELGVFIGLYAPIFEQIVQCWFDRAQDIVPIVAKQVGDGDEPTAPTGDENDGMRK